MFPGGFGSGFLCVRWKRQRSITCPRNCDNCRKNHLSVRRWESEKHKGWSMPIEAFRNDVTTDGSLSGISGSSSAYVWSAVQLDHDEKMGREGAMHGMYGTLDG